MAKYTMDLRTICSYVGREEVENWFKSYDMYDYLRDDEVKLIMQNGTWNKDKLAKKIVDHYLMREIGFETIGLFKHQAKVLMQEIMEEKLPLIYSTAIKYDPLVNVDYSENYTRTILTTGSNSSTSTNNASGLSVQSDTPQGQINKEQILQGKYASNTGASESTSSINDNSSASSNTGENYTKSVKGNSGVSATAQKMIEQYRQNIVSIDKDIINELNILFMGLF